MKQLPDYSSHLNTSAQMYNSPIFIPYLNLRTFETNKKKSVSNSEFSCISSICELWKRYLTYKFFSCVCGFIYWVFVQLFFVREILHAAQNSIRKFIEPEKDQISEGNFSSWILKQLFRCKNTERSRNQHFEVNRTNRSDWLSITLSNIMHSI